MSISRWPSSIDTAVLQMTLSGFRRYRGSSAARLLLSVLLAATSVVSLAQPIPIQRQPAPAALQGSAAAGSVAYYEQMQLRDGLSAPLLVNLGNAWLRAGHAGRAVLSYERALWLAPRDAVVESNLALARQRLGLKAPERRPWVSVIRQIRFDTYTVIGVAACLALLGCGWLLRLKGRNRRWLPAAVLASGFLSTVSVAGMAVQWSDLSRAVVLETGTPARIAPAAAAAVEFELREGETVHVEQNYGAFALVRAANGDVGWVDNRLVAAVLGPDQQRPQPASSSRPAG